MAYGLCVLSSPGPCPRRHVLGWIVGGAVVAVSGCTAGPTVQPRPGATRPAPPTRTPPPPLVGVTDGRRAETNLLAALEALSGPDLDEESGLDLAEEDRARIAWCKQAHRRRIEVLLTEVPALREKLPSSLPPSPDPTSPVILPFPPLPSVATPKSVASGKEALAEDLASLAEGHRVRAGRATGDEALLWASMAAGAVQEQVLLDGPAPAPVEEADHLPYVTRTEVLAAQELLSQVHALVFGYSVALTPISAQDGQAWELRLEQHRQFRDRLAELLRDRRAAVPAAEPEYETGDAADDPQQARELVAHMEDALLIFSGAWVAASREDEREAAVSWLVDGARAAIRAGAAPRLWPGWSD